MQRPKLLSNFARLNPSHLAVHENSQPQRGIIRGCKAARSLARMSVQSPMRVRSRKGKQAQCVLRSENRVSEAPQPGAQARVYTTGRRVNGLARPCEPPDHTPVAAVSPPRGLRSIQSLECPRPRESEPLSLSLLCHVGSLDYIYLGRCAARAL